MSEMNLDPNRLKSLDDRGGRVRIIPLDVKGIWRTRRNWVQAFLILVFLILPWTKINGIQTIHLDIPARQFSILGHTFWAHDTPILFFLLFGAAISLAFVTAIWGRAWCGWACPQTVFIDGIFRRIERWVEGSPLQRKQKNDPFTFRKAVKWGIWTFVSFIIAHSFAAYFTGAENLIQMMKTNPSENMGYFTIVMFFTAVVLFDFGWFQEQFCIIMCPYGRVQSLLMDKNSLAVIYDEDRGEPRKGHPDFDQKKGDCIDCRRCVNVCPTACDIRLGVQLECIACTACIDACDEVMEKVGKPKGLIRYDSVSKKKVGFHSVRNYAYLAAIILSITGLIYFSSSRDLTQLTVLRAQAAPYLLENDSQGQQWIVNHYKVHMKNQSSNLQLVEFLLTEEQSKQIQMIAPLNKSILQPAEDKTLHIFFKSKPSLTEASGFYDFEIESSVKESENNKTYFKKIRLLGPVKPQKDSE